MHGFFIYVFFLYGKERGWGISDCFPKMIQTWYREFRDSAVFRRVFLLAFSPGEGPGTKDGKKRGKGLTDVNNYAILSIKKQNPTGRTR